MPAVNNVGEPCAGEPHARFDGRGLETEHDNVSPRQPPTLHRAAVPALNPWQEEVEAMEACVLDGAEPVVPLSLDPPVLVSVRSDRV